MKGILGRKLGMSQVFDPETGTMTVVTVIEAGPCPVVQVKTAATDGYDAVQLAFEPVAERKLSKPEVGHLRKAGVEPHRHLVEVRGESGLSVGETTLGTTVGNLGFEKVEFPKPVFHGDTIYSETTVVDKRESKSRPQWGIVTFEHRARNQHGEVVMVARRNAMMRKKAA